MNKRKIIAILSGTVLSLGLLAGCSQNTNTNNDVNQNQNQSQNENQQFDTIKEQESSTDKLTITEITVSDSTFKNEDLSIDIENTNARYNGFIGNYDVWIPKDSSCLYILENGNDSIVKKISFNNSKFAPKSNHVLGAEDNVFYGVADSGEIFYVNTKNELMVIDLNETEPKISTVDLDFSINYISGSFVFVDGVIHREVYVVSNDGELYRINYVDAKQDGSGIYKVVGYDNIEFVNILKNKDSKNISVLVDSEYSSSSALVIRELNDIGTVEETIVNVKYDKYYSDVTLSLK